MATIFDTVDHRTVGFLSIENRARASDTASSAVPYDKRLEEALWPNGTFNAVTQSGHALAVKTPSNNMERRWFTCLTTMLMYIIANPTTALVADTLPPHSSSATYHFDCNPRPPTTTDKIIVTIFAAAAHHRLTWKVLVEELLIFGASVSMGYSWDTTGAVWNGGILLATLKVSVEGSGGMNVPSTTSSGTA